MASDPRRKQELPDLIERLMATYEEFGKLNHLGHCPLPHVGTVQEIVDDLKELLFPGYRRRTNLHGGNIRYYVGDLIDTLHDRLTTQIARALRHEKTRPDAVVDCANATTDYEALGQTCAMEFLSRLPEVRTKVASDVQAAFEGDPAATGFDEIIFCYPGLEAISIQRLAHELYKLGVPMIPRMMTELAHSRTGIDIHPGAQIGPGFFIDHGTGVVVGETCEIAAHCKLYQGVTLGALSFPKDSQGNIIRGRKRHPTLEEGVVIYANATVLGGNTVVGAGSVIGASVSLYESVPAGTVVTVDNKASLQFRDARLKKTS
jgi:serine O-acetyltransferase